MHYIIQGGIMFTLPIKFPTKKYSGLNQKMITSLIVFIILPLILFLFFINYVMKSTDLTHNCDVYDSKMDWACIQADNVFMDTETIALSLYTNRSAQALLRSKNTISNDTRIIYNIMTEFTKNKALYKSICISIEDTPFLQWNNGTILVQDDLAELEKTYQENTPGHWSSPRKLKNTINPKTTPTEDVLTFYGRIYDYNNFHNILGIISVSIEEEYISKIYSSILSDQSICHMLLNPDGTVLSSSDPSVIGTLFSEYNLINPKIKSDSGYFSFDYQQTPCVVFYQKSQHYDWFLVSIMPVDRLTDQYWLALFSVAFFIILCVIFAVFYYVYQRKTIIHPLKQLCEIMSELPNSQLNYRFNYNFQNEIGILYQTFEKMEKDLKNMIQKNYISEIARKNAELQMLISQINPHFLYNTLDAIRWLAVQNNDKDVSDKVLTLSNIFRHTLSWKNDTALMSEEIDILRQYIDIMNFQQTNTIDFIADIPSEYLDLSIPKFLLQPLIENSILHGLKNQNGTIVLIAEAIQTSFFISVYDDGIGIEEEQLRSLLVDDPENHNAFALKNVNNRIKLLFGEEYGLIFHSTPQKGTTVIINLPADKILKNL